MYFHSRCQKKVKLNRVIIAILILVIFLLCFILYHNNNNNVIDAKYRETKEVMALEVMVKQDDYVIQAYSETYQGSSIEAYYPVTKYPKYNEEIKRVIDAQINQFKQDVKEQDAGYTFAIQFEPYGYKNYVSFAFHVMVDFKGAHPNTYIFTTNYDSITNSMITIDTLMKLNNNVLNLLSKMSYQQLSADEKIKEIDAQQMLENGTKPTKENFRNFVFSDNGLLFFFEKYQVAPYAYGEFSVTIPYKDIDFKLMTK